MAMVYLLLALLAFALVGVPLAFAIGASSISYMLAQAPNFLQMLPQRVWNGVFSELMIAMPLFMLAGELMNGGGITQRIINFCRQILRPINGGMGEINVMASMIFGGIFERLPRLRVAFAHGGGNLLEAAAAAVELAVERVGWEMARVACGRGEGVALAADEAFAVPIGAHAVEFFAHRPAADVLAFEFLCQQ